MPSVQSVDISKQCFSVKCAMICILYDTLINVQLSWEKENLFKLICYRSPCVSDVLPQTTIPVIHHPSARISSTYNVESLISNSSLVTHYVLLLFSLAPILLQIKILLDVSRHNATFFILYSFNVLFQIDLNFYVKNRNSFFTFVLI